MPFNHLGGHCMVMVVFWLLSPMMMSTEESQTIYIHWKHVWRTILTHCFLKNTLCNVCSLIFPRSVFKACSDRTGPWHFNMYLSHSKAVVSLQSTSCISCIVLGRWTNIIIRRAFCYAACTSDRGVYNRFITWCARHRERHFGSANIQQYYMVQQLIAHAAE